MDNKKDNQQEVEKVEHKQNDDIQGNNKDHEDFGIQEYNDLKNTCQESNCKVLDNIQIGYNQENGTQTRGEEIQKEGTQGKELQEEIQEEITSNLKEIKLLNNKSRQSKFKLRRFLKAVSLGITIIMIAICIFGVTLINSYIKKLNLVNSDQLMKEQIDDNLSNDKSNMTDKVGGLYHVEEDEWEEIELDRLDPGIKELDEELQLNNKTLPLMDDKKVLNILLIGSDTRNGKIRGRSDVMILISINKKNKTITATSFMRDIYLQIPGKNNNRLNAAYSYGGAGLLMNALKDNFRINVDKYICVDFGAFVSIVDAVGGVPIEIKESELSSTNGYINDINRLRGEKAGSHIITKAGLNHLDGVQALAFSRNRAVGHSDFERTSRQRRILEQIFIRLKDLNILQLNSLLNEILPLVTTNFTEGEIVNQLIGSPGYLKYATKQLRIPVDGSYTNKRINGMAVLSINFDKNIQILKKEIYNIDDNNIAKNDIKEEEVEDLVK